MKEEKYITLIPDTYGFQVSEDFKTLDEAVKYGIDNNYGRGFDVAKRVELEFVEKTANLTPTTNE